MLSLQLATGGSTSRRPISEGKMPSLLQDSLPPTGDRREDVPSSGLEDKMPEPSQQAGRSPWIVSAGCRAVRGWRLRCNMPSPWSNYAPTRMVADGSTKTPDPLQSCAPSGPLPGSPQASRLFPAHAPARPRRYCPEYQERESPGSGTAPPRPR